MPSALELIDAATERLRDSGVHFGHGTASPGDEAVFLVLHALGLEYDASETELARPLSSTEIEAIDALLTERIDKRLPSAYLTARMWFAGLEFFVDRRVLVPRSPLAELIERHFSPWLDGGRLKRILEIGTGSGCIAIALAHYFPSAEITATDISREALVVARQNLARYPQYRERIELAHGDCYEPVSGSFDLIISNPPYVPDDYRTMLPAEYGAEPPAALFAGKDGLQIITRIIDGASSYLKPAGALVFDVGDRWSVLERHYRDVPFVWCELARGGEGIGIVRREDLSAVDQSGLK